jgi:hypothetical protein
MKNYNKYLEPEEFEFVVDRIDRAFPDFWLRDIAYAVCIFEFMNRGVDYHHSGKNVPNAGDMMNRLTGDCEDQSVLINSMFLAAGLDAGFIRVGSPIEENTHIVSVVETPLGNISDTCDEIRKFYYEKWNRHVDKIYFDTFDGENYLIADNFSGYLGDGQSLVSNEYIVEDGDEWYWSNFLNFMKC